MTPMFGPIKQGDGVGAMRERGFQDGYAGREQRLPADTKLAAAYRGGYEKGATERAKDADQ